MNLLWGRVDAPSRGPKPGTTVDEIAAAAIAVADADGLAGLSMRKVAERLGKSAMSLYTYVPGKAELLDVMLDRVHAGEPTDYSAVAAEGGWRAAAEAAARDTWSLYERHPWMLQLAGGRSSLGPHELDAYESRLAIFADIGLPAIEVPRVVGAIANFVAGSARVVTTTRTAEQATGISDDEWWTSRSALLDELAGDTWAERYPVSSRLGDEHAFDQPDRDPADPTPYLERDALDAFEFGLSRLLDGIAAHVDAATGSASSRPEPSGRAPRRAAGATP
jgi:AcrR family transcriptional regulator